MNYSNNSNFLSEDEDTALIINDLLFLIRFI